mmetsp:Transcript_11891/g.24591  ORF Transcript_11891/g.24591 Transcript_11891/m.24591 type:complete len:94 (-) Transcript_11891:1480-1761(-)
MVVDSILVLLGKEVGLGKEKDGDGSESDEKKDVLDEGLAIVHRLVDVARLEGNVDKTGDKVRRLATVTGSTEVQRALLGSRGVVGTVVSPRGT